MTLKIVLKQMGWSPELIEKMAPLDDALGGSVECAPEYEATDTSNFQGMFQSTPLISRGQFVSAEHPTNFTTGGASDSK